MFYYSYVRLSRSYSWPGSHFASSWMTLSCYRSELVFQQRIEIHKLRHGDNLILGFSIGGGIDQDPGQNPFSEDKTDKVRQKWISCTYFYCQCNKLCFGEDRPECKGDQPLFLDIYRHPGFHSNPDKAHLNQQLEHSSPTLFLEIYHPPGFHSYSKPTG